MRHDPHFQFLHIDVLNERYNKDGTVSQEEMKLPYEDSSFDIIYLYSVFSHLLQRDIEAYLKEFIRLLRPKGSLFLTAFVEDNVPEVEENPSDYQRGCKGRLHCMRYERSFFDRMVQSHGFAIDHFVHGKETDGQSLYKLILSGR